MPGRSPEEGAGAQRLDKWLWHARLVKSRTIASRLLAEGRVRVNREKISKSSRTVKEGDVITAAIAHRVLVLKVLALSPRRRPLAEAQALYEEVRPFAKAAGGR